MKRLSFFVAVIFLFSALPVYAETFDAARLVSAAEQQVGVTVHYDGAYRRMPYPNGDVPPETGVCSDVVIRAYRALGIDLQQRVHEDMKAHFVLYPKTWGLTKPDTNIDHRRVPNLQVFFKRRGQSLPVSNRAADYLPGDMVTWNLAAPAKMIPHIGIVSASRSADGARLLIVHNIGSGTKVEDILFEYKITGHYRYAP
ncbi:MAG: DUF1287 domain-containing protein [Alphaproteobacteria bacterium]|nr:DUF1287 domain-containing protein [Alphaproteobacteria bacterium]